MPSSPRTRAVLLLALVFALAAIAWLAVLVLREAVRAGAAEAWMMAGILAIVVGLPVAMLLLPVIDRMARAPGRSAGIVPNTGVNVPGAGQ